MLKGNKGEWSEIYAFCYLLNNGKLLAADKDLNPTKNYFPILKILREENRGSILEYIPSDENRNEIQIFAGENLIARVDKSDLSNAVSLLFKSIPSGERVFEIPEVSDFLNNAYINKLKADSRHKQDINIQLHDIHTGVTPVCGFSIKSYLGSNPTLINAGSGTNFVYHVENCTDEIMDEVNGIDTRTKIIDRLKHLKDKGCLVKCTNEMISAQFRDNLWFVDSKMPEIISEVLRIAYSSGLRKLSEAVDVLKIENPLGLSNVNMYEYKIKKMLCACALGMTPERVWEGEEDANGGYIVVKEDGTVVCYHIYNRREFEQYLYDYTCFEKPSMTRYQYMSVYKDGDNYKIKLNLQVRFI